MKYISTGQVGPRRQGDAPSHVSVVRTIARWYCWGSMNPSGSPHRVLVVDDNVDSAESLTMLLTAMGNEARAAYTGEDALKVVREFGPHAVLLDIGMPGMDGLEV